MTNTTTFNRIEVESGKHWRSGKESFKAVARNEMGQGWQIPLRDMKPSDLRRLADMMVELGIGEDEYGTEVML